MRIRVLLCALVASAAIVGPAAADPLDPVDACTAAPPACLSADAGSEGARLNVTACADPMCAALAADAGTDRRALNVTACADPMCAALAADAGTDRAALDVTACADPMCVAFAHTGGGPSDVAAHTATGPACDLADEACADAGATVSGPAPERGVTTSCGWARSTAWVSITAGPNRNGAAVKSVSATCHVYDTWGGYRGSVTARGTSASASQQGPITLGAEDGRACVNYNVSWVDGTHSAFASARCTSPPES